MKKWTLLIILTITMLLIAACSDEEENSNEQANDGEQQEQQEQEPLEITEEEVVDEDEPVVVVNGEEVSGTTYNSAYSLVKSLLLQTGQDTSDLETVKDQTVDFLIEQELVRQAASEEGIEVTDEEVEEELNMFKENSDKEQFNTMLDQLNMTEESFKNQLKYDLTTAQYAEQEFTAEVTDEEVEEYYNQISEQSEESGEEVGELEEMEGQIRASLEQQERNQQYSERIEELKGSAEVEQLI